MGKAKAKAKRGKRLRGPWGEVWCEYVPSAHRFRARITVKTASGTSARKSFTGKSPAEVERKLEAWWRRHTGYVGAPRELVFGEFFERWIRDVVEPSKAPATATEYRSVGRNHLLPAFGSVALADLSVLHLQDLVSSKIREGYAPAGVRRIYAVASSALKQAVRWRMISSSPAEGVVLPPLEGSSRRALTPEQVKRLFWAAKAWRDGRLYPVLVVAVTTGLRQGEILGLFWDDLDLERGVVVVRRTISRDVNGPAGVRYGPPKGRRERLVELPWRTVELLAKHRKAQAAEQLAAGSWTDPRHVFTTAEGKPIHRAVLLESFKRLCRREGLPAITFHELRHTCATLHAQRNAYPSTVQRILGHRDIKTTLGTYSHEWPNQQRDAAESLSELLF